VASEVTPADVKYWKKLLNKVLKVGIEVEFNMPTAVVQCNKANPSCVCKYFAPENMDACWSLCKYHNKCQLFAEKKCLGTACSMFISWCVVCNERELKCDECALALSPDKDPDKLREKIIGILSPNNSYGTISKSGVHSIVGDGSLLGGKKAKGLEVVTIGRRVDYWEFFKMAKNILSTATKNGAWANERCSIHMHLLASYYNESSFFSNSLEKPIPNVIMANFHQLIRRYQNALVWMSMGLDDPNHLTRWEKFRVSILPLSAVKHRMADIKQLAYELAGGRKYSIANYMNTAFDENGDATILHVELRHMDCVISPSIIAAMACLNHALMIKAVEISKYGLLKLPGENWFTEASKMKNCILNNTKPYGEGDRFGKTERVLPNKNYYIKEAYSLIQQLKHILIKTGPAYEVLEKLAEMPAALLRVEGRSWDDIESYMAVPLEQESLLHITLSEYMDLRLIKSGTSEEWIEAVSNHIWESSPKVVAELNFKKPQDLKKAVNDIISSGLRDGEMLWSDRLNSMVSI